jgi:hypothetical protein
LNTRIEGYRKTDAPATIANRFVELVAEAKGKKWKPRPPRTPKFLKGDTATKFEVKGGRVWIDIESWPDIRGFVETHSSGLVVDRSGKPTPALPSEEFANKDSELLACSVECRLAGLEGFFLQLDVPGLDELIGGLRRWQS